jgi:hypothetical protein
MILNGYELITKGAENEINLRKDENLLGMVEYSLD